MQFALPSLGVIFRKLQNQRSCKSCEDVQTLCKLLLKELAGEDLASPVNMDERVAEAVKLMQRLNISQAPTKIIAEKVYLSESRLAHLFKENIGIPIRRYLLWSRLAKAVAYIFNGETFTSAAHSAGFADAAHFSRTFKQMFGLNLREIFKNSQFVQVNFCDD